MGYSIYRPANAQPQTVEILVSCDRDHGLLPKPAATFTAGPGEVPREVATKAGWRFLPSGTVECPECKR